MSNTKEGELGPAVPPAATTVTTLPEEREPVRHPGVGGEIQVKLDCRTYPHRTLYPEEVTEFRDVNHWMHDDGERGDKATDYDGHFNAWGVVIDEHDYLKTSHLSGDEVRKAGRCRLFFRGEQVYEFFHRDAKSALVRAVGFMNKIEDFGGEFPGKEGALVWYREIPAKIVRVLKDQGCVILERRDGKPWNFGGELDEAEPTIKIDVLETCLSAYWPHAER